MKTTRSLEFLWRLTKWRELYFDLRRQPFICLTQEMSIEECHRRFPELLNLPPMPPGATSRTLLLNGIGMKIGQSIYAPLEVEVDPYP